MYIDLSVFAAPKWSNKIQSICLMSRIHYRIAERNEKSVQKMRRKNDADWICMNGRWAGGGEWPLYNRFIEPEVITTRAPGLIPQIDSRGY